MSARIPPTELGQIYQHLDGCPRCHELVVALTYARRMDRPDTEQRRLGRYTLLREIGAGAFGVVYAARDESLAREVAIKFVDAQLDGGHARLAREARAMAQVSHGNVAHVYETGESPTGQTFIVMELVEGERIDAWLERTGPRPSAIVKVFAALGRGLAAAHAAGVVHRDFKPANAIVSSEGIPKVIDFGLAGLRGTKAVTETVQSEARDPSVTSTGALVGTPAYMSPEQHEGKPADARSDQYCFSVVLFEALFGAPPFPRASLADLRHATLHDEPSIPATARISGRLRGAVLKGLARDPADRWPDMTAYVMALTRADGRRATSVLVAAGTVALGLAALAWWSPARQDPCASGPQRIASAWDGARLEAVEAAIHHAPTRAYSVRALGRYADAWAAEHREACLATRVHGEQSDEALDLRMRCLSSARRDLSAAVDVLSAGQADLASAYRLVDGLPRLSRCVDVERLRVATAFAPEGIAAKVDDARETLARAGALRRGGLEQDAQAELDELTAEVAGLDFGPLQCELALERGRLRMDMRDTKAAQPALHEAMELAIEHGLEDQAIEAIHRLAYVVGYLDGEHQQGLAYIDVARAMTRRDPDPLYEARIDNTRGTLLSEVGEHEAAKALFTRSRATFEAAYGTNHPSVATSRNLMAVTLTVEGDYADAAVEHRAVVAILEATLGGDHPTTSESLQNLGAALAQSGRLQDAEASFRDAIGRLSAVRGGDHPTVARARVNLATTLYARGSYAVAEQELRQAIRMLTEAYGEAHLEVASTQRILGMALDAQGKYEAALPLFRQMLAARVRSLPEGHAEIGVARGSVARALSSLQRFEEAEVEARAAVEIHSHALGADHPNTARLQAELARILDNSGKRTEAEAAYRSALASATAALGHDHTSIANILNDLAVLLNATGRLDEADASLSEALKIQEKALAPGHPAVALTLANLGDLRLQRRRPAEAVRLLERAYTIHQTAAVPPHILANTEFKLATALHRTRQDPRRARALATAAEARLRATPERAESLTEVRAWLRRNDE